MEKIIPVRFLFVDFTLACCQLIVPINCIQHTFLLTDALSLSLDNTLVYFISTFTFYIYMFTLTHDIIQVNTGRETNLLGNVNVSSCENKKYWQMLDKKINIWNIWSETLKFMKYVKPVKYQVMCSVVKSHMRNYIEFNLCHISIRFSKYWKTPIKHKI